MFMKRILTFFFLTPLLGWLPSSFLTVFLPPKWLFPVALTAFLILLFFVVNAPPGGYK